MKKCYLMIIATLSLVGCDLVNTRRDIAESKIAEADGLATMKLAKYKAVLREPKEYKPYHYLSKIEDPFRIRGFLITDNIEEEKVVSTDSDVQVCEPPSCKPADDHIKEFLENYSLDDLRFVGTLTPDEKKSYIKGIGKNPEYAALIKTPDVGVVIVTRDNYMGKNSGRILDIQKLYMTLQERGKKELTRLPLDKTQ